MTNQRHSGFTLLELMITLAILAILVAIAAPSMSGLLERRKLHGAGENLFADLMFAKTEAIKRNETVRVSFTGTGATWCYGMAIDAACDCTAADCTIDGVLKVTDQDDFPGVSLEASSTLDGGSASFTPLRGAGEFIPAIAPGVVANIRYSVSSGSEYGVRISSFGRVSVCSETDTFTTTDCTTP